MNRVRGGIMPRMNLTPRIVIIDDFLDDPNAARAAALNDKLELHPERHKGWRGTERPIEEPLSSILAKLLGKTRITNGYAVYQLCVAGDQLVYHTDDQDFAAVLYLTPDAPLATGTSFFKSKATGARCSKDLGTDAAKLALTFDGKLLDRTAWEEVDRFGNVYNRLALWDARTIHGATDYFGSSLANGRLFEMMFFSAE